MDKDWKIINLLIGVLPHTERQDCQSDSRLTTFLFAHNSGQRRLPAVSPHHAALHRQHGRLLRAGRCCVRRVCVLCVVWCVVSHCVVCRVVCNRTCARLWRLRTRRSRGCSSTSCPCSMCPRSTTCRWASPTALSFTTYSPWSACAHSTPPPGGATTSTRFKTPPPKPSTNHSPSTAPELHLTPRDLALSQVLQEFNRRIYKLYDEWKAKKLTTFALQVQPFSANRTTTFLFVLRYQQLLLSSLRALLVVLTQSTPSSPVTIPNLSYLSTLDCFHPSLLAHQKLAIATWNRYRIHLSPPRGDHLN